MFAYNVREREPLQLQAIIGRLGCQLGGGIEQLYPSYNQSKSPRRLLTAYCAKNATCILYQRSKHIACVLLKGKNM